MSKTEFKWTPENIQAKLDNMKGKCFEYAKQIHVVKSYIVNAEEESFTIKTNLNSYDRKFSSAKEFFSYWFELPTNMVVEKSEKALPATAFLETEDAITKSNNLADDLVAILKDNIAKVSRNAAYVDQAKAVDKSVGTILNVKKMQLQMYLAVNKKRKNDE